MSDRVEVVLELTPDDRQRIETLAHKRGYDAVSEYILSLIEADEEEDDYDPVEAFREAWHDAMTGNTLPASALWDIDEDDE